MICPYLIIAGFGFVRSFETLDRIGFVAQEAFAFDTGHDDLLPVSGGDEILFVTCVYGRL